jgi:hypothetical protein
MTSARVRLHCLPIQTLHLWVQVKARGLLKGGEVSCVLLVQLMWQNEDDLHL